MDTYTTCNLTNSHLSERTWFCSLCDKNMNGNSKLDISVLIITSEENDLFSFLKKEI